MYTFTKKEVLQMQSRPYEDQIATMDAMIAEALDVSKGDTAVAFSGGKDSCMLLFRVARMWSIFYPNRELKVFYNDTTIEYIGMNSFVKQFISYISKLYHIDINFVIQRPKETFISVIRREGLPLVSKRIAKSIKTLKKLMSEYNVSYEDIINWRNDIPFRPPESLAYDIKMRFGGLNQPALFIIGYTATTKRLGSPFKIPNRWLPLLVAPFQISDKCCEVLKHGNIPNEFKGCTIMTGEMAEESEQRMRSYMQTGCNQIWHGGGKSKPMGPMTLQTVLRHLYENKIPIFKNYGEIVFENGIYKTTGMYRTGCALCGFGMTFIPDRYKFYDDAEINRLKLAFKPLSEGGLGYLEAFQYCNEYCGTNWYIPNFGGVNI